MTLGESLSLSVLLSLEEASFIPRFGGLVGVRTARPSLALPGCEWYVGVESAVQFFCSSTMRRILLYVYTIGNWLPNYLCVFNFS